MTSKGTVSVSKFKNWSHPQGHLMVGTVRHLSQAFDKDIQQLFFKAFDMLQCARVASVKKGSGLFNVTPLSWGCSWADFNHQCLHSNGIKHHTADLDCCRTSLFDKMPETNAGQPHAKELLIFLFSFVQATQHCQQRCACAELRCSFFMSEHLHRKWILLVSMRFKHKL